MASSLFEFYVVLTSAFNFNFSTNGAMERAPQPFEVGNLFLVNIAYY